VPLERDPLAGDRHPQGAGEDPQVEPEAAVVDVPDVECQLLVPRHVVPPVDLRPAGQPGLHLVPARLLGRVPVEVLDEQRTGTDERHLPDEDVPQLREFVERGGAQEPAEGEQPLLVGQQIAVWSARIGHGPELADGEDPTVQTWPRLGEQHRSSEFPSHPPGHDGEHGRQEEQSEARTDDVEQTLGTVVVRRRARHTAARAAAW
jgi:hypothetical protein